MAEPPVPDAPAHPERRDAEETAASRATVGERPSRRAAPFASDEGLARGTSIGRYVVIDLVGRGGMGQVYKAYDPELDRPVAVKLVEAASGGDLAERMHREAQALARLSHPNVVAVHDVGTFEGLLFIAMEFVAGGTLREWLEREKPDSDAILAAYLAGGEGLLAAHRAGMVHRDFKPDNVLRGEDGRIRVVDFGLARGAQSGPTERPPATPPPDQSGGFSAARAESTTGRGKALLNTPITFAGAVLGTPRYMAPEQILGERVDERSDQFSFCVALYEALYRQHPFGTAKPRERDKQVLAGQLAPVPPEAEVQRHIRRALLRGLMRAPDARFASMAELLAALRRDPRRTWRRAAVTGAATVLVAGLAAVVAHRMDARVALCRGGQERFAGVWDGPRRQALASAFAATGVAFASDTFAHAAMALDRYAQRWVGMRAEACEATRVRGEQSAELLDLRMACLDQRLESVRATTELFARPDRDLVRRAPEMVTSLPPLDDCADGATLRAVVRPPADAKLRARVDELRKVLARARALRHAGRYRESLALAQPAVEAAQQTGYAAIAADLDLLVAGLQEELGDYDADEKLLRRGMSEALAARNDDAAAVAWIDYIWFLGEVKARYAEAHLWTPQARAAVDRLEHPERHSWQLHDRLSHIYFREGKFDEALLEGRQALALAERRYGAEAPELGTVLHDIANVLTDRGDVVEALKLYQRALAIAEKQYGPRHPETAIALNNLSAVHFTAGRYREALVAANRALTIVQDAEGLQSADVADTLLNAAVAETKLGQLDDAVRDYERALAIEEKLNGRDHPDVAHVLLNLSSTLLDVGQVPRATAQLERVLAIWTHSLGADHAYLAYAHLALGRALLVAHRWRDAIPHFRRGRTIAIAQLGATHAQVAEAGRGLADALEGLGQRREAIAELERSVAIAEKALGKSHPEVAPYLVDLGQMYARAGQREQALPLLERALAQAVTEEPGPDRAEAYLALARALGPAALPRALELASSARDQYAAFGDSYRRQRDEAAAWVTAHRAH